MENPSTNRFREEFKSMNCRLERPTAVIIPGKKSIRTQFQSLPTTTRWQAIPEAEDRLPAVLSLPSDISLETSAVPEREGPGLAWPPVSDPDDSITHKLHTTFSLNQVDKFYFFNFMYVSILLAFMTERSVSPVLMETRSHCQMPCNWSCDWPHGGQDLNLGPLQGQPGL